MKQSLALVIMLSSMFAAVQPVCAESDIQKPNIVFMLSDDQNWNGLSVAMHPNVPGSKGIVFHTPTLAKLASQGMRFSAAYSPAPVCSPTRISLQTGKSPAQMHWTKAGPSVNAAAGYKMIGPRLNKNISARETTVAELLRSAGYATAHYGKWHLANNMIPDSPLPIGNEYAQRYGDPNPVDIFGMARRASAFMEKNKRARKPFFIQLSWHALHSPQNALKTTRKKYDHLTRGNNVRRADMAAMTEDLDSGVGVVLEAIDRLGLADNTYVIYMQDEAVADRAKSLGIGSVPAIVIDGKLADCCTGRGPDEATLRAAGLGQPMA